VGDLGALARWFAWGFTVIDFASVHSSARQSGKFALPRMPLATSVTRLPPDGGFHPQRASRRAPPALLESISKWSQSNRLHVECLRTTSQICTLIANFTMHPGALVDGGCLLTGGPLAYRGLIECHGSLRQLGFL
jgi:hypothetical protein